MGTTFGMAGAASRATTGEGDVRIRTGEVADHDVGCAARDLGPPRGSRAEQQRRDLGRGLS